MRRGLLLSPVCLLHAVLLLGCTAAHSARVIDVRDVSSAGGAPSITSIVDLGTAELPEEQQVLSWEGRSDNKAVIGELILVRGSRFGKQPRVTVGGRGTLVLAHVAGGGVVVKVPWGIDAGQVEVEVGHDQGSHSVTYPIRRLGVVTTGRRAWLFEVGREGALQVAGELPLPGPARFVTFSFDGAVALIGGARDQAVVWIMDLTPPRPRVLWEHAIPGRTVVDLVSAAQSPLGAVVTDTHLSIYDTTKSMKPAFFEPHQIARPLVEKKILAAAMGGRGQTLGLLLADLNEVAIFDTSLPQDLSRFAVAQVLPDERFSLVQDLRFSPDGGSLWVASGNTTRSLGGGSQPARLTLLQISLPEPGTSAPRATVHRAWELGEGLAPQELAVARGEPIPPGTAIRPEPSTSAVYISVDASEILAGKTAAVFEGPGQGAVVRSSLDKASAQQILAGRFILTSQDVVGKTQVLLALGCAREKGKLWRVLLGARAWEQSRPPSPRPIEQMGAKELDRRPLWLGVVRAQP